LDLIQSLRLLLPPEEIDPLLRGDPRPLQLPLLLLQLPPECPLIVPSAVEQALVGQALLLGSLSRQGVLMV
jgi:hypothetical protein